jgi:hypothetical protein
MTQLQQLLCPPAEKNMQTNMGKRHKSLIGRRRRPRFSS